MDAATREESQSYSLPRTIYRLAAEARRIPQRSDDDKITVLNAWKRYLNEQDDDLVIRFLFLMREANHRLLIMIDDHSQLQDDTKKKSRDALASLNTLCEVRNVSQQWKGLRDKHLTDAKLTSLQFARDLLANNYPVEVIGINEVECLSEGIEDLINQFDSHEIDSLLRVYITRELQFMQMCIRHFHDIGVHGLRDSVGRLATVGLIDHKRLPKPITRQLVGVALLALTSVSFYGDFRAGIDTIQSDAEDLREIAARILRDAEIPGLKRLQDMRDESDSS